jgi:anti-anti-sigma factor
MTGRRTAVAGQAVTTRTFTHTTVVVLRGRVDAGATERLRHVLVEAIVRRRPRRLVVDIAGATELDPTALGTLIAAREAAPDMNVRFTMRCPNPEAAVELLGDGLAAVVG